tara:strand:+ start:883 stop:1770 length:888 start_codon:yes stop_codon:yes gene_type:complete
MPYEIDYALLSYIQLKKTQYYLPKDINIEIDTVLNCSDYLIDWNKSILPKSFFIQKFNELNVLLKDYTVNSKIYEGDKCYGLLDMQRDSYCGADYYMNITPDMYFSEHLLPLMFESTKLIKNKYFVITPEIHKMWDGTWDEIINQRYMDVPYANWNDTDVFEIRHHMKTDNNEVKLDPTRRSKWAWWLDLYNREFYEDFAPVQDDWFGYGPWDWWSLMLTEYAKERGADFQEYVLRGQTIFEYPIGSLKGKGFVSYHKDFMHMKSNAPQQRANFEANMELYLKRGIKHLEQKNII